MDQNGAYLRQDTGLHHKPVLSWPNIIRLGCSKTTYYRSLMIIPAQQNYIDPIWLSLTFLVLGSSHVLQATS